MNCPNCGAVNHDGAPYCGNCGAALNAQPQQPVYQQPVYQQPVYQQPVYQQPVVPGKGQGIAGMVLGIIALVFMCVWYIGIPCSIIGLILSASSNNKAKAVGMKNGAATAGVVCSCIALGLTILVWVLAIIGLAEMGFALESMM